MRNTRSAAEDHYGNTFISVTYSRYVFTTRAHAALMNDATNLYQLNVLMFDVVPVA